MVQGPLGRAEECASVGTELLVAQQGAGIVDAAVRPAVIIGKHPEMSEHGCFSSLTEIDLMTAAAKQV
jgi:hypothetical protein